MTASTYSAEELDRFREVQQLAYRAATETAAQLEPGVTEKRAAEMLGAWLHERGVSSYFHQPFAWFGDRTCFRGFTRSTQFFPTERRLLNARPVHQTVLGC